MILSGAARSSAFISVLLLGVNIMGCAAFRASSSVPLLSSRLSDDSTVTLKQVTHRSLIQAGPAENFAQISAWISRHAEGKDTCCAYVVANHGFENWHTVSGFEFGRLEARSDSTHQRVWWIDTEAHKVVATIDRKAQGLRPACRGLTCSVALAEQQDEHATGPSDAPPEWATLDGGTVLESITVE